MTEPDLNVALLGTGLIGGSIGLALRRIEGLGRIRAFDADPEVARRAVARGAADEVAVSPGSAVAEADLVFVATPVGSIPGVVGAARERLRPGTIVTDVGSTKARVVREVESMVASRGASFIGGHPMAGTEEDGIEAARPGLFEGVWWILTPTEGVEPEAFRRLHAVLGAMGARVMAIDPERHDELVAIISHLPHLTATALMNLASRWGESHAGLLALAAGGFRDMTRVAASNPGIWLDICRENHRAIAGILEEFIADLQDVRSLVMRGDAEGLEGRFRSAREARRGLGGRVADQTRHEIWIQVPDRPGVLAEITTQVGNLGVNIEDLEIVHDPSGGRGVLRLTIAGAEESQRVATALGARDFECRVVSV